MIIQGVLDNRGGKLLSDGTFTATWVPPGVIIVDIKPYDASQAYILATTAIDPQSESFAPAPVTIEYPGAPSHKFKLLLDQRYGVSFRVEVHKTLDDPSPMRTATAARRKKK